MARVRRQRRSPAGAVVLHDAEALGERDAAGQRARQRAERLAVVDANEDALTFSIAAGIGFGVVGYVAVMIARGRIRAIHPVMWLLVPLFLVYYADRWLAASVF
jgi:hypothetical protein